MRLSTAVLAASLIAAANCVAIPAKKSHFSHLVTHSSFDWEKSTYLSHSATQSMAWVTIHGEPAPTSVALPGGTGHNSHKGPHGSLGHSGIGLTTEAGAGPSPAVVRPTTTSSATQSIATQSMATAIATNTIADEGPGDYGTVSSDSEATPGDTTPDSPESIPPADAVGDEEPANDTDDPSGDIMSGSSKPAAPTGAVGEEGPAGDPEHPSEDTAAGSSEASLTSTTAESSAAVESGQPGAPETDVNHIFCTNGEFTLGEELKCAGWNASFPAAAGTFGFGARWVSKKKDVKTISSFLTMGLSGYLYYLAVVDPSATTSFSWTATAQFLGYITAFGVRDAIELDTDRIYHTIVIVGAVVADYVAFELEKAKGTTILKGLTFWNAYLLFLAGLLVVFGTLRLMQKKLDGPVVQPGILAT